MKIYSKININMANVINGMWRKLSKLWKSSIQNGIRKCSLVRNWLMCNKTYFKAYFVYSYCSKFIFSVDSITCETFYETLRIDTKKISTSVSSIPRATIDVFPMSLVNYVTNYTCKSSVKDSTVHVTVKYSGSSMTYRNVSSYKGKFKHITWLSISVYTWQVKDDEDINVEAYLTCLHGYVAHFATKLDFNLNVQHLWQVFSTPDKGWLLLCEWIWKVQIERKFVVCVYARS